MNLSTLTSEQFRKIVDLLKQREALVAKLNEVEKKLSRLNAVKSKKERSPKTVRSTQKLSLKDEVLQVLAAAGKKGLRVRDLAKTVKRTSQHLSVWFSTAGRKVNGLKRVGYGHYAYHPKGK